MKAYRCQRCSALLFKAAGLKGAVQAACRKCGLIQMVYGDRAEADAARLTVVAA